MRLWRISEYVSLDGGGGLISAGRWHRLGRPIAYLAESAALAMLEVLVNTEIAEPPAAFQLIAITAPDRLQVIEWPADQDIGDALLTSDWGDAFLRSMDAPLARVPSIVAPESWNYLLNPLHPDAHAVTIERAARWAWDARLFPTAPSG